MPYPPHRPEQLVGQVFRGADALDRGLLTRSQLRSSAWRRLLRGTYVDADVPLDHGVLCAAAMLIIPPAAAIAGRSAAWLHGARLAGPRDRVEVVVPRAHRFGPVSGLAISTRPVPARELVTVGCWRFTTAERTGLDIARRRELIESVVVLDALAAARRVTAEQLGAASGLRSRGRAARAIRLMDGRSESPQESRLRIQLVLAGLPPPVPQFEIRIAGRFLARVDLAWPAQRVALEYDGIWHADPVQLGRDRRRLNRLVSTGWTVLHVTGDRLRHDLPAVVAEVRAALACSVA